MTETVSLTSFWALGVLGAVLIIGGFAVLYWFLSRERDDQ